MENYSLADLAAVTGANDGFGCGGNGGILSWILIFALLGGGGLGFGFGNANRANAATTEDLANGFNFNGLQNKTNEILAAINSNGRTTDNAICQLGYQGLQNTNTLAAQIAECCCNTQRGLDSVKFDMANYASGLQIAQMQGTQKVLDKLCAMESAQKDAVIAQQGQRIAALEADARMCGVIRWPMQSTYAVNCNPFGGYSCNTCNTAY